MLLYVNGLKGSKKEHRIEDTDTDSVGDVSHMYPVPLIQYQAFNGADAHRMDCIFKNYAPPTLPSANAEQANSVARPPGDVPSPPMASLPLVMV